MGRADVEVGIGKETEVLRERMYHEGWAGDYELSSYAGVLSRDGIVRMNEIIMKSSEEIILICIGPMVNIAKAASLDKRIVERTRIVTMLGSLRSGWFPHSPPVSEYNVICSTKSAQSVFRRWGSKGKITMTPLDTCGRVYLSGSLYATWKSAAADGSSKVSLAILQNFEEWAKKRQPKPNPAGQIILEEASSTLFDTVAVFLAFSHDFLKMEELNLSIANDGKMTILDEATENTSIVNCATEWTDMDAFCQLLVERLLKDVPAPSKTE